MSLIYLCVYFVCFGPNYLLFPFFHLTLLRVFPFFLSFLLCSGCVWFSGFVFPNRILPSIYIYYIASSFKSSSFPHHFAISLSCSTSFLVPSFLPLSSSYQFFLLAFFLCSFCPFPFRPTNSFSYPASSFPPFLPSSFYHFGLMSFLPFLRASSCSHPLVSLPSTQAGFSAPNFFLILF